jgi:hypothetical protein
MGYYVTLENVDFTIPADKVADAFEAMKALNSRDDLKTGGSWQGGKQTERWFAWMDADYDKTCKDAKAILDMLGFEVEVADDGGLSLVGYDSKTGSEEHFVRTLAPFVKEGSYMEWRGEEGDRWRWVILNGQMTRQQGHTVFE